MRLLTILLAVVMLSACTAVPEQIQGEYPSITPVRVEPGVYGTDVRWGGVIMETRHTETQTCFEILSRELDKYLRPLQEDYTGGRYIACKQGFQDPAVFTSGREVTTTGQIRNIQVRDLEGFKYRYPVLDVDSLVLWEKRRHVVVYRGFHDPWHYRYPWGYPYHGFYRPFPYHSGYAEQRTLLPDPSLINSGSSVQSGSSTTAKEKP